MLQAAFGLRERSLWKYGPVPDLLIRRSSDQRGGPSGGRRTRCRSHRALDGVLNALRTGFSVLAIESHILVSQVVHEFMHFMHRISPPTSLCSSGSKPAVTRQKFGAPSVRYSSPSIRRLKPRVVCWLAKYLLFDHYLSILEVVAFF
jgi:hypothetical protein